MLEIRRDNTAVIIRVETDLPHDCAGTITGNITFKFDMSAPSWAELLTRYLRDRLAYEVRKIRREAYEQGWKDAKSKNRKQDWFSEWL